MTRGVSPATILTRWATETLTFSESLSDRCEQRVLTLSWEHLQILSDCVTRRSKADHGGEEPREASAQGRGDKQTLHH